jgi:hypothetical protein
MSSDWLIYEKKNGDLSKQEEKKMNFLLEIVQYCDI